MQAAARLTARRTFNNLTSRHAGIHKHDAKGNCHYADQDSKQRFQITHSATLYQQQKKGVHGGDKHACRVERQPVAKGVNRDLTADVRTQLVGSRGPLTAVGARTLAGGRCMQGRSREDLLHHSATKGAPQTTTGKLVQRTATRQGPGGLRPALGVISVCCLCQWSHHAPSHHLHVADSGCALQTVPPAQRFMADVDSRDAGDVSLSAELMLLLQWQTSAIREPDLPRGAWISWTAALSRVCRSKPGR